MRSNAALVLPQPTWYTSPMANQYTAHPLPSKVELEHLYAKGLTQTEIGGYYHVSQKVVFSWFRKLNIKSRIAAKRYQTGSANHAWKGDNATYAAYHYRMRTLKGRPRKCEVCGTSDPMKQYDWASLSHDYANPDDYKRMCRSCHWKFDGTANNLGKYKGKRYEKCT